MAYSPNFAVILNTIWVDDVLFSFMLQFTIQYSLFEIISLKNKKVVIIYVFLVEVDLGLDFALDLADNSLKNFLDQSNYFRFYSIEGTGEVNIIRQTSSVL